VIEHARLARRSIEAFDRPRGFLRSRSPSTPNGGLFTGSVLRSTDFAGLAEGSRALARPLVRSGVPAVIFGKTFVDAHQGFGALENTHAEL